jgi:YegS/Rv2252/BmrU family lipid kinase
MPRVLADALERGAKHILVGGGDGTVSCAIANLLGRNVTLGVLPLGTGNDFARSLGIESTVEAACDVIAEGYTARVDVGLANGRPFLNAASLGLATAIAKRLTKRFKQRMGKLAYPLAAASEAWDHQPFRVRMTADSQALELEVLQLVVGNGRYHGAGNMVAPNATLDDHRLHVYAITAPSSEAGREGTGLGQLQDLSTLAQVAMTLRSGQHVEHPSVTYLRTSRLYVEADPVQEVNADGELIGRTPMLFEVVPSALRVYAPAPAPTQAH